MKTDDGTITMTPTEIEAELTQDPLGVLVHVQSPLGGRSCGAVAGRMVAVTSLAVTCARCIEHQRVGAARLLAALAEVNVAGDVYEGEDL